MAASYKVGLDLTSSELAVIEFNARVEAFSGTTYGEEESRYGTERNIRRANGSLYDRLVSFHRMELNNSTVTVLNAMKASIHHQPVDQEALDCLIDDESDGSGSGGFDQNNAEHVVIAKRFGQFYRELVVAQLSKKEGDTHGIPANAFTVGYPLQNVLEDLRNHPLSDTGLGYPGANWDFMVDSNTNRSFFYIVKVLSQTVADS